MKKVFAWVMAAVMLLSMGTISASASRQHHGQVVSQITTGLRSACVKVEHRYRSCGSCGGCAGEERSLWEAHLGGNRQVELVRRVPACVFVRRERESHGRRT